MTVKELYKALDDVINKDLSCDWDNDGLMCSPDTFGEVKRVLLALDVTKDTVDHAKNVGADLIITHHPLIFKPVKNVSDDSFGGKKLIELLKNGISVFSFHTRLDAMNGGVNDALAEKLCLTDIEPFGCDGEMIGRIGNYHQVDTIEHYASFVKLELSSDRVNVIDAGRKVKRVAVCGGDGKDFLRAAFEAGADTYVTGGMSYNSMLDAYDMGINVVEAGHYHTEVPVLDKLAAMLNETCPGIEISFFDSYPIKVF